MKTKLSLFLIVFIVLIASSFAVTISPSNPTTNDNLVCSEGSPSGQLFKWFKDGNEEKSYVSNVLPSSATSPSETWRCIVIQNLPAPARPITLGDATVKIQSNPVIPPVVDSVSPYWIEIPTNRLVQAGNNLYYDVNASDNVSTVSYSINDTSRFQISGAGVIQNKVPFYSFKTYHLRVTAKDAANNVNSTSISVTVNGTYNLYGDVYDLDNGSSVHGANISFYTNSDCALDDVSLTGSCTSFNLQPKSVPDATTDSNGHYSVYLPSGTYHMVVQHSKQVDYDIVANDTPKRHDAEVNEKLDAKDYNFEGHIIYGGSYENGNKYIVGDNMTFVMFGITKPSSSPVTVTYAVERHIPVLGDSGSVGALLLNGSFTLPSQTLYVPGDGTKVSKIFNFVIPPKLSAPGRYDIHVLVNNSGTLEKWHKIGNFFILGLNNNTIALNSTTRAPPELRLVQGPYTFDFANNSIDRGTYVNETFNASFRVKIYPQPSTINGVLYSTTSLSNNPCVYGSEGDEVTILASQGKISINGTFVANVLKANVTNARVSPGCYITSFFNYGKSDKFKINISVKEKYYKAVSPVKFVNVSIWATEQQARNIWFDISENFILPRLPANFSGYFRNVTKMTGIQSTCINTQNSHPSDSTSSPGWYTINFDYMCDGSLGFEYRSVEEGMGGVGDVVSILPSGTACSPSAGDTISSTSDSVTLCEKRVMDYKWHNNIGSPQSLVSNPSITKDLANEIAAYLAYNFVNNSVTN